jgi:multimeric flavodoxin WrbA
LKITVISGSPKGKDSITLHYIKYLEKHHPDVEFCVFDVGSKINKIDGDREELKAVLESVQESSGVLWAFPVYFFLVPSQLKRFIEIIFENNGQGAFKGKYTAQLMTSIHFYDTTACDYMKAICHDLEMRYTGDYMAEMYDLLRSRQRKNILAFCRQFLYTIEKGLATEVQFMPLNPPTLDYRPEPVAENPKSTEKKVVLLTDERDAGSNLGKMVDTFQKLMPYTVQVINIRDLDLKGGCLGCIRCGYDNTCVYKDDLAGLYEKHIFPADAVIISGRIHDRYLSSRWKMFFDRSFFMGHTPVFFKKHIAFIISGPLTQIQGLRSILEAKVQFNKGNLVGMATDEYETSEQVTALLTGLSERLAWSLKEGQEKPAGFYGLAGHLIFRDFVYRTRGVFRADHLYYQKNGLYDFPNKNKRNSRMNMGMLIMQRFPSLRRQMQARIVKDLVKPFKSALEK